MVRASSLKVLLVVVLSGGIYSWGWVDVLGRNIGASSNVVNSYAAECIKELLMKEQIVAGRELLHLMVNLFKALKFPGSEDNEYLMKCIFQVLIVSDINGDVAELNYAELTSLLSQSCQKQKNVEFNENIFSALIVLVQGVCEINVSRITQVERGLSLASR